MNEKWSWENILPFRLIHFNLILTFNLLYLNVHELYLPYLWKIRKQNISLKHTDSIYSLQSCNFNFCFITCMVATKFKDTCTYTSIWISTKMYKKLKITLEITLFLIQIRQEKKGGAYLLLVVSTFDNKTTVLSATANCVAPINGWAPSKQISRSADGYACKHQV